ncbi:AI-2E family transporter [Verrucomicrobiota bacterium sgz303538]
MNGSAPRSRVLYPPALPVLLVIAVLYFAKEFFIPLALAILFSFLLAPLIKRLERWHFNRVAAVLSATALSFAVIAGIGWMIGGQLIDLANDLPKYKSNLQAKVSALKTTKDSPISKATETIRDVTQEIASQQPVSTAPTKSGAPPPPSPEVAPAKAASPQQAPEAPVPVSVVYTPGNAFDLLKNFATPLLGPLGTAALVIVFVIFILLELEDLRDRVIHLIGHGHLQVTTQALSDAGKRVSRYLLAQLIVNVTYGIPIGIGLYFIGVPNAVLWGLMATILRFIPYIGPWIAAAFPIALSLAVAPGWNMPLLTIGLFVVIELISNNVVEPWLYGSSTGLSPVAIIVAAAFWTWLWGAVGLLLATPLTVCIAVLGKYIPSLTFLDVLLGDKPPIAPEDRFYQRLLAQDAEEICEIAEGYTDRHSLAETFENVIIPALQLCEDDFRNGLVTETSRNEMHRLVRDLVVDVGTPEAPPVKEKESAAGTPTTSPVPEAPPALICLPASSPADELTAHMLARLLAQNGVAAEVCPSKLLTSEMVEQVAESPTRLIVVSALPPRSVMPATLVCKRLRQRIPDARINVGIWGEQSIDERRRKRFEHAQADTIFTSLTQAEREIIAQIRESIPVIPETKSEPTAVAAK